MGNEEEMERWRSLVAGRSAWICESRWILEALQVYPSRPGNKETLGFTLVCGWFTCNVFPPRVPFVDNSKLDLNSTKGKPLVLSLP